MSTVYSDVLQINACDSCRRSKDKCTSPVHATSTQRRKPSPQSPEAASRVRTAIAADDNLREYDDQPWVAAANNIVAELARTNGLLGRNISVAEESRLSINRLGEAMEKFIKEQGDNQERLLHGIRHAIHNSVNGHPDMEDDGNAT